MAGPRDLTTAVLRFGHMLRPPGLPLTVGELKLVSWWFEGALGFNVRPWMRVEGFYNGVRQTIDRPGGLLNRNRIGVQLVAAQPVRMQ